MNLGYQILVCYVLHLWIFKDVMLTGLCATTQMGLQLTDNPRFMAKKPSVNPDYVCFYKKSAFVHGPTSTELDDMWLRICNDQN
jgi:hypothetical protein